MSSVFNICGGEGNSFTPAPRKIVPQGTLEITENGEYDVSQFANALVAVAGGGGGGEVETGIWETPGDNSFIYFNNEHTSAPTLFFLAYAQQGSDYWANGRVTLFEYVDFYKLARAGFNINSTEFGYALIRFYRWDGTRTSEYRKLITHNSDDPSDTDASYCRYFATEERFRPNVAWSPSSSHFLPIVTAGTWHWIAVWL